MITVQKIFDSPKYPRHYIVEKVIDGKGQFYIYPSTKPYEITEDDLQPVPYFREEMGRVIRSKTTLALEEKIHKVLVDEGV